MSVLARSGLLIRGRGASTARAALLGRASQPAQTTGVRRRAMSTGATDPFRTGWEFVSTLLDGARSPGHPLDAAANLTAPTLRALCHQLGFVDEAARKQTAKSRPPKGRGNRTGAEAKQAGIIVQLCNQATLAGQVWPSLVAFVAAQRGTSSRAIWRAVQAVLHSSAQAAEALAAGKGMAEAGLAEDATGVFAPRPAALQALFDAMPPHRAAGEPAEDGLFEQEDASAESSPDLVPRSALGAVSTLWQVDREVARLRAALAHVDPAVGAGDADLASALGAGPDTVAELLLGISEACVTAAAVATTPEGDAAATAQVPPGAVAALLRLQVAAGHGDRAEASLARAHDAGMLLQMRHYEPVLRLRASQRRLREVLGLLGAMHERGVTSNADVCDEAYGLAFRCVALALEAGQEAAAGGGAEDGTAAAVVVSSAEAGAMTLAEAAEAVASSVDGDGRARISAAQAEAVATSLLAHAEREVSHPGPVLLAEVEALFSREAMRGLGWRLARSEIGPDGRCSASGRRLSRRMLSGAPLFDAVSLIRQVIVEHEGAQAAKLAARSDHTARRGGRGGAKGRQGADPGAQPARPRTPPRSVLSALDAHIARHGPFDLIVDGANVGLFRRAVPGGYLSYNQLDALVQHAQASGLRTLVVLHSRWMRPTDLVPDTGHTPRGGEREAVNRAAREQGREEMVSVLGRWRRDCPECLFVVPRGNDDVYWMYAAMQSQRLKLRGVGADDPSAEAANVRRAVVDEVVTEEADGRRADEAAAAAAATRGAEGPDGEGSAALVPRDTVWLATNDFMRDHKGELLQGADRDGFGEWRAGIVKVLVDRNPRWYAAGSAAFDAELAGATGAPHGGADAAGADGRARRAADAYAKRVDKTRADAGAAAAEPSAPPTSSGDAAEGWTAGGAAAAPAGGLAAALGGGGARNKQRRGFAAPVADVASVDQARQIVPEHGAGALDQLRRGVWFVLPHPFSMRFHSPDPSRSAFFFPGFDKAVDDAGGVPDVPDAPPPAPGAPAEAVLSLDAQFETAVRRSRFLPLSDLTGREGKVPGAPLRWSEDRPEKAHTRAVLPPDRPWFVLYRESADERS